MFGLVVCVFGSVKFTDRVVWRVQLFPLCVLWCGWMCEIQPIACLRVRVCVCCGVAGCVKSTDREHNFARFLQYFDSVKFSGFCLCVCCGVAGCVKSSRSRAFVRRVCVCAVVWLAV